MRLSKILSDLATPVPHGVVVKALALLLLLQFAVVPAFYDLDFPLRDLPFGFGPFAEAVATKGSLLICPFPDQAGGYCRFAYRMPLMPYLFGGASRLIGDNVLYIAILKTALLDLLLLYYLARLLKRLGTDRFVLAILVAVAAGPQFMLHSFSPLYEEGILIQLLAVLTIIQIEYLLGREHERARWTWLPAYVAVSAAIYLVKSSMILVVVWSVVFLLCCAQLRWRLRIGAALAMCLPVALWGAMTYDATGRFAIGTSIDGLNLLKGNNPLTLDFYPHYSLNLDIGDGTIVLNGRVVPQLGLQNPQFDCTVASDEWHCDDALRTLAIRWAIDHPGAELRLLAQKLEVFFLDVRNSPVVPWQPKPPVLALVVGMAWMAVMRVLLWSAISAAACAIWRRPTQRSIGLCFLVFLATYAAPYIVGYGWERHVVPVLLPTALFLSCLWRFQWEPRTSVDQVRARRTM